jgi:hypothetical protein
VNTRLAIRRIVRQRVELCLALSGVTALVGLHAYPFPATQPLLAYVATISPRLFISFSYGYALLWCTTPFIVFSVLASLLLIVQPAYGGETAPAKLPLYPPASTRRDLFLILGERHYRISQRRASAPVWFTLPERGLFTGIAIVGAIGSGKTSACVYPYLDQLLGFSADAADTKLSALVLEVKGDLCAHVQEILKRHGRSKDYVEISLTSPYRYNPLHNDLDAYALAFGIATLMTNLFGRGKEPFWQQASTNLVKFVILLHQTLDDYVTLFQVYEHVINPEKLRNKIRAAEARFADDPRRVYVNKSDHLTVPAYDAWEWHDDASALRTWTYWSPEVQAALDAGNIPRDIEVTTPTEGELTKRAQFEAVKRWFEDDWMRIEPKLRTSIVEGISVFLSLFDDNPAVKHTFCPPKQTYDVAANANGTHGIPLPPIADLIEQGKVIALNFPAAMNPGLARALGTMLKQDFQRAVLNRIPRMANDPARPWRPVVFLCDEYQSFATSGENEPSGDEKFFSLARQARCIPIVATQSISSLRSVLPGESWRTLLQGLRTKVFLALSDDFSAHVAAELCGRAERLKPSYTLTEAGQDARVSLLTGRPAAHRATVSATKTYNLQLDYVFQPKVFSELQNAQAIVLAYDGANPLPPSYCYLKPHYLDVRTSYFDHRAAGAL